LAVETESYSFLVPFDYDYTFLLIAVFRGGLRSEALFETGQTKFVEQLQITQIGARSTVAKFSISSQSESVIGYKVWVGTVETTPVIFNHSSLSENNGELWVTA